MRLTDIERTERYTFQVRGKQGLVRAFMEERHISFDGEELVGPSERRYTLYVEPRLKEIFKLKETVRCIVSFQVFTDGEHIAVAREWMPRKNTKTNKQHKHGAQYGRV